MRKSFVFFALVPAIALIVVLYIFLDGWVESGLESAGERAVGARVEIDNLTLTLFPLGVRIDRVQVANPRDPWKNLFETGRIQFALDVNQLLRAKYIVETVELNDLVLGTKRATDGSIPRPVEPVAPAHDDSPGIVASVAEAARPVLAKKEEQMPSFDLEKIKMDLNVDSLLRPENLRTYRLIDSLKQQAERVSGQWGATLTEFDQSQRRLAEIEAGVRSLNVNEIKTLDAAKSAYETVERSYRSVQEISTTFQARKKELTDEVNSLSASLGQVGNAAQEDFRMILGMARLPDVNMRGLAEMVLGKELIAEAYEYLYWVDIARNAIPTSSAKPEMTQPRRFEGQDIRFPVGRAYPKVWVKKIHISGGTDKEQDPNYFYAKGEVRNISSDQRASAVPLTIDLSALKGRGTVLAFNAQFDRLTDVPVDHYQASLTGVPVGAMETGRSDFLPSKISHAMMNTTVAVDVPGSRFESLLNIRFADVEMTFDRTPRNVIERLVRDVLASVRGFNVSLRLWNAGEGFRMAFATDLDDIITSKARQVAGAEIARMQNDLRARLNARIAVKRQEYVRLVEAKKQEALARVRVYEQQVNETLAVVDAKKKELEKKVDDEKKRLEKEMKDKGKDLLKDLIRKP